MAKKRRLKKTVARKLKLIIYFSFFILSCILYSRIYLMNIVPDKYLKLLLLGLCFINVVIILLFTLKNKFCKIIGFFLYLILFIVYIIGIKYSNTTLKFLNSAFKIKKEVIVYDVITLKDSSYNELKDLENKSIGLLNIDNNDYIKNIKDILNVKTEDNDLFNTYNKFINNKLDGIVINESYLTLLEDQYEGFKDLFKIVYTFDIELEMKNNVSEVKKLKPVTIYITGLDSRSGKIESAGLSDVNMLVTINPKTNKILLTGIPRDYFVQLHGTTGLRDKLTHAGMYGAEMSKNTVEDLFDMKIDYTVKVGFNSVIDIVDMIGGIDINSDKGFWSYHYPGWFVEEGINHMDGEHALAYARERYAYKEGDEHRVKNQLQVFTAIFEKIIKDKSILFKYDTLLDELSDLYSTNVPKSYVTLLIKDQINDMKSWNISNQSVTGTYINRECYTLPGIEVTVMEPDTESVKQAKANIEKVLSE